MFITMPGLCRIRIRHTMLVDKTVKKKKTHKKFIVIEYCGADFLLNDLLSNN